MIRVAPSVNVKAYKDNGRLLAFVQEKVDPHAIETTLLSAKAWDDCHQIELPRREKRSKICSWTFWACTAVGLLFMILGIVVVVNDFEAKGAMATLMVIGAGIFFAGLFISQIPRDPTIPSIVIDLTSQESQMNGRPTFSFRLAEPGPWV